tara:strand:- start:1387 stop:3036 length:1650 start_codon:yes stop_codon:yes gene_type:complete
MFFKYIYIFILLNFALTQSYFNRINPEEYFLGDARSMAMGNIIMNSNSNGLVVSNPALMSFSGDGLIIDLGLGFKALSERRSVDFKDYFGSFLGQSDYVFNQKNTFSTSFSSIYNWSNFAFGFSYNPFLSFAYNYEEQVRGGADDNVLGIRDPIIGYHIFNTSGDIYLTSLGFSYKFKKQENTSIGFSFNQINSSEIKERIEIVNLFNECNSQDQVGNNCIAILLSDDQVLSSIQNTKKTYHFNDQFDNMFYSISFKTRLSNALGFNISYETNLDLYSDGNKNVDYPSISTMVGLPQYLEYVEVCDDQIDNNGDGAVDCEDLDCSNHPLCLIEDCENALDDDGDNLIDCDDSDCSLSLSCSDSIEVCTDGIDNDNDGLVDCDDSDCTSYKNSDCYQLEYSVDGVRYHKPEVYRFGISFHPKSIANLLFSFEIESKSWSIDRIGMKNNINKYKIGFEYAPIASYPIRAGLIYSESVFNSIGPSSILTLGTGKNFGKVEFNVGLNYAILNYRYIDIFPTLDNYYNSNCDIVSCDEVTESNLRLLTTIKVRF